MRRLWYYCVDGSYSKYSIFIDNIPGTMSTIDKHLFATQEALRKDVARAFCSLICRWRTLHHPCMIWDKYVISKVITTAIILHDMILEYRRNGYDSDMFVEAEKAV